MKIIQKGHRLYSEFLFLMQFAFDDFKKKYLGSVMGTAWAFLQPLVTILIYWFVFQLGFKSAPVEDCPFILWLISGLIPWFFFSESITAGTTCLIDYEYLVKKVRFNVDILPCVKAVSCFWVQLCLIFFTMVIFCGFGYMPDWYNLQLIYYLLYMSVLALGLTYVTASLYVFFKDTIQIISILLQVVFWMTPMVWSISIMPEEAQMLLRLNPFFFVVSGYRKCFISHELFLTDGWMSIYYWGIAVAVFVFGVTLYRRLKGHFADIL